MAGTAVRPVVADGRGRRSLMERGPGSKPISTFARHALSVAPELHLSATMTDTPPDRLSANPGNPFYDEALLERGIGVRFKGVEKTNVDEYCISEGWVRVQAGAAKDRRGNPMTILLKGPVEVWFKDEAKD
jgi:hypothetical protein